MSPHNSSSYRCPLVTGLVVPKGLPLLDPRPALLLCQASDPAIVGKGPGNLDPPPHKGDSGETGSVDVGHSRSRNRIGIGYPNWRGFWECQIPPLAFGRAG